MQAEPGRILDLRRWACELGRLRWLEGEARDGAAWRDNAQKQQGALDSSAE